MNIVGAEPWHLYSVYFIRIGANPCNEKVFIGEFLTNKDGGYKQRLVRKCGKQATPVCLNNWGSVTNVQDPYVAIVGPEAGHFVIYSRGYSKEEADGSSSIVRWKTDSKDTDSAYGALLNPRLWNDTERFDGIQFIVGV